MHLRRAGRTAFALFFLAAATLAARGASAGVLDIRKADNAVSLDLGTDHLDYAETAGGATLDSEKGWLPSIGGAVDFLAFEHGLVPNLYLHLDGRASFGSTAYDGALCDQYGNCTPIQGGTGDTILTGAGRVGRAFTLSPSLMVTPFAELGYRFWERRLKGTGGYVEHYSNWDALGGVMAQYSPVARWVLSVSGAAGKSFDANLSALGLHFPLGSRVAWRTRGRLGYRLTERLELTSTLAYESLGFGASPVVGGYYEPDSTTHQTSVSLGLAWHFF